MDRLNIQLMSNPLEGSMHLGFNWAPPLDAALSTMTEALKNLGIFIKMSHTEEQGGRAIPPSAQTALPRPRHTMAY